MAFLFPKSLERIKKNSPSHKTRRAVRYIFFVIANKAKQSVESFRVAITKKDATSITARTSGILLFKNHTDKLFFIVEHGIFIFLYS